MDLGRSAREVRGSGGQTRKRPRELSAATTS